MLLSFANDALGTAIWIVQPYLTLYQLLSRSVAYNVSQQVHRSAISNIVNYACAAGDIRVMESNAV